MIQKRFPWKLFSRIVALQAILLVSALLATGIAARHFFKKQFLAQVEIQLHTTLDSLSRGLEPSTQKASWCRKFSPAPSFRLTLITQDGEVICDSHHDPKTMENHLGRPEIIDATQTGFGQSIRYSSTLNENMVYGAVSISDPTQNQSSQHLFVRGSIPIATLVSTLSVFDTSLTLFLIFLSIGIIVCAIWSGRTLAFPIGRLLHKAQSVMNPDPAETLGEEGYGELSELESSLDDIKRDLEAKAESLSREREEHAIIMSALSDAILAVDLDGSPLFFNSRFLLLFDHKERRLAKLRLWEMFRDPEILEAFRSAFSHGNSSHVSAIPLDSADTRRFFSISVAPLRRGSGEVYGAVGVFHDVTELKRAEQIRIDFVANVSHELRTPLTAIKGYADTLGQDLEEGRPLSKEFVDIIIRNTSRLMSLITDLLDLSSLESNVDSLHRVLVSTDEASERVLKQVQGVYKAKNQNIELEASAPTVYADPQRLEQVLVNLIDNATKYTPPGGKITVSWDADKLGFVCLRVADTGPGIPPEHHARLFERFYRVDKARSRELGGTGLGLAIVKHIMQRHGGTVAVESKIGQGTTFICRFPATPAREVEGELLG